MAQKCGSFLYLVWMILFWCTFAWWDNMDDNVDSQLSTSYIFKTFILFSYNFLISTLSMLVSGTLVSDKEHRIIFFGCLCPLYIGHTTAGSYLFFEHLEEA
jgi:hypothetical protein